jgi:hypothetical protein
MILNLICWPRMGLIRAWVQRDQEGRGRSGANGIVLEAHYAPWRVSGPFRLFPLAKASASRSGQGSSCALDGVQVYCGSGVLSTTRNYSLLCIPGLPASRCAKRGGAAYVSRMHPGPFVGIRDMRPWRTLLAHGLRKIRSAAANRKHVPRT